MRLSHTKRFATRDDKRLNVTKCRACLPPKQHFTSAKTSKHDNFWSARQQNSHMAFFVKPQTPERRNRTDLRASAAQGKFRCASSSNLHNPNESPWIPVNAYESPKNVCEFQLNSSSEHVLLFCLKMDYLQIYGITMIFPMKGPFGRYTQFSGTPKKHQKAISGRGSYPIISPFFASTMLPWVVSHPFFG